MCVLKPAGRRLCSRSIPITPPHKTAKNILSTTEAKVMPLTGSKNENIKLYRRVDFVAESGIIYTSNVTKIEKLNDKQIRVTLGALRNSLTDFKKKVEAI